MARPREFDRSVALRSAIALFNEKGFAAASTDELVAAMGISRQSMYDTFGDKRTLYLEALRTYAADAVEEQIGILTKAQSPIVGLEHLLMSFASNEARFGSKGCMGVNAVCEFGPLDPEINLTLSTHGADLDRAIEQTLRLGKRLGEISPNVNVGDAGKYIVATLTGLKIAAKAGQDPSVLKRVARLAIRAISILAQKETPSDARDRSSKRLFGESAPVKSALSRGRLK